MQDDEINNLMPNVKRVTLDVPDILQFDQYINI